MKILAIAYACEPNRGSEPGVGWNWVRQIAKQKNIEITVITRANNSDVIKKYYENNLDEGIKFIYYDLPKSILKYKRGDKAIKLFFSLWQIGVIKFIKKQKILDMYDYVWDFNFGSLALPTFCYKLKKRYVIGPVSTKESIPKSYIERMKKKEKVKYKIQQYMRTHLWTNPFTWHALKYADIVVTCNEMSRKYLPPNVKSIAVFHNGLDLNENIEIKENENEPVHLIYSGRLIKSKNIEVAIEAINLLGIKKGELSFSIYGSGPEKKKIESLVNKYDLQDIVKFCPKIKQKELFEIYKKADIYMFPSLLEISSTSVMEAMYYGLLPVCLNINCMEYIINNDAVVKVDNISFESDAKNIAKEIRNLLDDKNRLLQRRIKCASIARHSFVWQQKYTEVIKIINELKR